MEGTTPGKDGDAMMLNGYFGNASTWLLLGFGWLIVSIVTSLIFGAIARYDGRKGGGK